MNLKEQRRRVKEAEQRAREATDNAEAERKKLLSAEVIVICKDLAKVDPEVAYQVIAQMPVPSISHDEHKRVEAVVDSIRKALPTAPGGTSPGENAQNLEDLALEIHRLVDQGANIGIQHGEGYETVRAAAVREIRIQVRHRSHGEHKDIESITLTDGRCLDLSVGGWWEEA